jgi:two-component system sensor histidine kinase AgrC
MIVFICNLGILLLNIIYTHLLLSRIKSIKYCVITFVLTNIVIFFCVNTSFVLLGDTTLYKVIFYAFAFLIIIYINLVFKESLSKKIFTMFSIWLFSTMILFVSTFIVNSVFGENYAFSKVVTISIRFCAQVALVPLVYYFRSFYKKMLNIVQDKTVIMMSFYPIIGFLVLINSYNFNSIYFVNINNLLSMLLFFIFIVLGYAMVITAILTVSKNASLQLEYRIIENQIEFQKENYKTLSEAIQDMYALRHDTRHHITFIKTMIEEKNYEKALTYIQQFNQQETNNMIPTLCENFTADSIVKYYMSIALNKNIEFKTKLSIPNEININNLDLCVVLGNCLENAIDACDRTMDGRKKYIYFQSKIIGPNIVLKITNSFNGEVSKSPSGFKSTKENRGHGIGLSNIHKTVTKYKGILDIKYTEDEFDVDIVMNINLTTESL